jgi:DNA-binding MarR family transcriptional regulator
MSSTLSPDPLELVHQVMHQVRALQRQALREEGDGDVTPMEARVLGFFARHPGATLKELSEHSGRDKAQLARLIKGLRERGWLSGEADEADRRNQRLTLTPEGQAVHGRLRAVVQRIATRSAAGMPAADRHRLCELLGQLRDNLAPPAR